MASKYKGYLLKFGNVILPLSYIAKDTGNVQTPNQREEVEAYRDDWTRELYRVTSDGRITSMSVVIRPLRDNQKLALDNVMKNSLVNEAKREYDITFWNIESSRYERGVFYIPDIQFQILNATEKYIKYGKFTMQFIGVRNSVPVEG